MEEADTLEHMRTTAVLPKLANREMRSAWHDNGRPDTHVRALDEASEILTGDNPAVFSEDVDSKIRTRFEGLVDGNVRWES
jgi:trimethylamine--corrinoid protein Co-methyltransferase